MAGSAAAAHARVHRRTRLPALPAAGKGLLARRLPETWSLLPDSFNCVNMISGTNDWAEPGVRRLLHRYLGRCLGVRPPPWGAAQRTLGAALHQRVLAEIGADALDPRARPRPTARASTLTILAPSRARPRSPHLSAIQICSAVAARSSLAPLASPSQEIGIWSARPLPPRWPSSRPTQRSPERPQVGRGPLLPPPCARGAGP